MKPSLLKEMSDKAPKEGTYLGLDVGSKTIGLAIGSPLLGVATPLETIKRTKFTKDMQALHKIAREHEIVGYIVGLPVNMDGSEGRRAQSIRDFAAEMNRYLKEQGVAEPFIAFWDERLSTVSVESVVDNLVDKRKTKIEAKSSGLIDKLAAQIILQGALDFIDSC